VLLLFDPFARSNRGSPTTISKEAGMTARNVVDENKRLVTVFYELAINQQKPAEAARKYIELPYRQHNPEVVDGPDGFLQFISAMQEKHPKLKIVISKVLADDDLVALHVHLTREASDPGLAIAELFRLKNGKIIEHWDVVQPVPAKTASGNSMF
jgi:predicted SnoaL-like aldol condensation-catalyzing enzyme